MYCSIRPAFFVKGIFFRTVLIVQEMIKHSPPAQNNTREDLFYNESSHLLHEAVKQLPEKRKQIFELCHFQGLTYQETADKLGITSSTVNSQMVKARKFIRNYLHKENNIHLPD